MAYDPMPLSFDPTQLNGISERTIKEHYEKLYQGYIKKYNEIQEKLGKADTKSANATYSEWRGLKVDETYALDAIVLHELYFDNLGGDGNADDTDVAEALKKQYGSLDRFREVVTATGMAARGWAVVAFSPIEDKFDVYAMDAHNQGAIWGAAPILVLDTYEHAYYMDYGSDKKSYIEAFWSNVDWAAVDARYVDILEVTGY